MVSQIWKTSLAEIVVGRGRRESAPRNESLVMNGDIVPEVTVEHGPLDMIWDQITTHLKGNERGKMIDDDGIWIMQDEIHHRMVGDSKNAQS
jgi:hypothetical protein